ncbi:MAG: glycosyltransferase, partial [bacterium]
GFPNVLLEANALGVPVVSFSYPGGVSEIINHGENGFLVRNNNFNDLLEVFQNKKSVNLSRKQIKNMTKDKYGIPKIIYKYEMLFAEILNS